jgi:TRAP-type C4-dicarboxylate transport system substrate-binding protein
MGAETVNISFANAMPRLKDGSLQGVLSSGDGGAGRKLWEFLPNFTALNYAAPLSLATINAETYAALPPDLRQAVDDAALATETAQWQLIQSRLESNMAQMRANGVTIAAKVGPDLSKQLVEAARRAVQEWAGKIGPDGDAILAAYRARR